MDKDFFSEVTGGRLSLFQVVTEWGTLWLRSEGAENREGGGLPAMASRSPFRLGPGQAGKAGMTRS